MAAGRQSRNEILAAAARFVSQAEQRCAAQARIVDGSARSPESRRVAERMLHEMRRTLEIARLHEAFPQTLDEVSDR